MRTKSLILAFIACLVGGLASAQFGRRAPDPGGAPPEAEFHMARFAYFARGCAGSRGYCNPWWAIDYPHAEAHFLPALERMTRIEVAPDSRHLTIDDEYLFDYPWLFVQQPGRGEWLPQGEGLARLQEYLARGGFLILDDFHGEWEWRAVADAMAVLLPGRPIIDIPDDDMLHHILFDLDKRTHGRPAALARYLRRQRPAHRRDESQQRHGRCLGACRRFALPRADDGDGVPLRRQLRHLRDHALRCARRSTSTISPWAAGSSRARRF
jgi:hypothetical protein